jgi:signal transduction histidine kinase
MNEKYVFKNNLFKIILKPISSISFIVFVTIFIVFIGMSISAQYTLIESLKVLLMIPATIILITIFFSIYAIIIYFTFEIIDNKLIVKTWFHTYKIDLNDIVYIKINKLDRQAWLKIKTNKKQIKLYLVGPGGQSLYKEFFSVLEELKKSYVKNK